MKRDPEADRLLLTHILQCIENVEQDVQGQRDRLTGNRTIRDAVLRNLQILAESTQRLSDSTKTKAPEIPWKQLEGFRHRLVHDYFEINLEIVWSIVEEHLPPLKAAVNRLLAG
jgi:uncharacterized protein with HEPN domain